VIAVGAALNIPPEARTLLEASPQLNPLRHLLEGLSGAYEAARTNTLIAPHVRDLGPVIERLWHAMEDAVRKDKINELVLDAADEAILKTEAALLGRVAGTTHTFHEELVARPGANVQKLLVILANICGRILDNHADVFGTRRPALLYSVGGIQHARSHWYLRIDSPTPQLFFLEVAGRNLLKPRLVVYPLMHELMHVLAPRGADQSIALAFLAEVGRRLATLAETYLEMVLGAVPEGLEDRIVSALRGFFEDMILRDEGNSWGRAKELARLLPQSRSLLLGCLAPASSPDAQVLAPLPATLLAVAQLDHLSRVMSSEVEALIALVREVKADVAAAFASDPQGYLAALVEGATPEERQSRRIVLVESVVLAASLGPQPPEGSLATALLSLARCFLTSTNNCPLPTSFYEALGKNLSEVQRKDLTELLAMYPTMVSP
jgi:hypothetical protein